MTTEFRNLNPQRIAGLDPPWPAGTTWAPGTYRVLSHADGKLRGRDPGSGNYIERAGVSIPLTSERISALTAQGFAIVAVEVAPPVPKLSATKVAFQLALEQLDSAEPIAAVPAGPGKDALLALSAAHPNCFDMFDALALDLTVIGEDAETARRARIRWTSATIVDEEDPLIVAFGTAVGFDTVAKRRALFALAKALEVGADGADELAALRLLL